MAAEERVTVIIRVIRSFEYRNIRNVILKDVPLTLTTEELKSKVDSELKTQPNLPPPLRNYAYDTFKIEHHAHKAKTNDPVINRENDEELILKSGRTLREADVQHETVISYFKMADYEAYKSNPVLKWE